MNVLTNPLAGSSEETSDEREGGPTIDATSDGGIDNLESLGLPVKRVARYGDHS